MTTKMNNLGPSCTRSAACWPGVWMKSCAGPPLSWGSVARVPWHAQDSAWLDAWTIEDGTRYVRLGLLELIFDPKTPRPVSA